MSVGMIDEITNNVARLETVETNKKEIVINSILDEKSISLLAWSVLVGSLKFNQVERGTASKKLLPKLSSFLPP